MKALVCPQLGGEEVLRVASDGGHGAGETRRQEDEEDADTIAFLFWRAGLREWQPVLPR